MNDVIRTPRDDMKRVRHLGTARSGTTAAWHMRLTSLALVPLAIGFVWLVLAMVGQPYVAVYGTLSHPAAAILLLLFILAGIFHMQLGMRTIIEDYIHGDHAKDAALAVNLFFSIAVGMACVYAVLRLSFV